MYCNNTQKPSFSFSLSSSSSFYFILFFKIEKERERKGETCLTSHRGSSGVITDCSLASCGFGATPPPRSSKTIHYERNHPILEEKRRIEKRKKGERDTKKKEAKPIEAIASHPIFERISLIARVWNVSKKSFLSTRRKKERSLISNRDMIATVD